MKYVLVFGLIAFVALAAGSGNCPGCTQPVEGDDLKKLEETVKKSLSAVAAANGEKYELVRIIFANTQIVAGTKHTVRVELKDGQKNTKTCVIVIVSQPWMPNGTQTTLDCPGERRITKAH